jgi:hypothetical protein
LPATPTRRVRPLQDSRPTHGAILRALHSTARSGDAASRPILHA